MSKSMLHDFGVNKVDKLQRSKFPFNMRKRCEFRQGALIPIVSKIVMPNSTWSCRANADVRLLLTPLRPFMGEMYFTYGFYFVPLRILFKDFTKMFGNAEPVDWQNPIEYVLPSINFVYQSSSSWTTVSPGAGYDAIVPGSTSVTATGNMVCDPASLINYNGLPVTELTTSGGSMEVSLAKEAAYLSIWNTFWRDQNYQNSDPDVSKIFNFAGGSSGARAGLVLGLHYANGLKDYLTTMLPNTQKGPSAIAFSHLVTLPTLYNLNANNLGQQYSIKFGDSNGTAITNSKLGTDGDAELTALPDSSSWGSGDEVGYTNLGVEISVNSLRLAFATQRARERDARTGNRFVEAMLGIFESHVPNAVADLPEFLGGNTIQLNLTSVPSTAGSTTTGGATYTPGQLGAFSFTRDNSGAFVKTFVEPGVLMCVGCVRHKRVYAQGIERDRTKLRRFDFYDPAFAHIPEQPVYAYQMLPHNSTGSPRSIIGFQEAWAEDVKPIDEVSGLMGSPAAPADLKKWNLLDFYTYGANISPYYTYPEDKDEIANACVDYNSSYPSWQFALNFTAECDVTAPRPVYCQPGLIDHLVA